LQKFVSRIPSHPNIAYIKWTMEKVQYNYGVT